MKSLKVSGLTALIFLVSGLDGALAKVVFTGYGDLRFNPGSTFDIGGDSPVLGKFSLGPMKGVESRSFSLQNVGLFATTSLSAKTAFLLDFNYADVGTSVKTTRIQYAYLEYNPTESCQFKAGKITLPLGYFNDHLFYPFQRDSISAPVFISGILGLPVADAGASLSKTLGLGSLSLGGELYAVNGYGPLPTTKDKFRSSSLPGGLAISGNFTGSDANHKLATGGRFRIFKEGETNFEVGISGYQGQWNPGGTNFVGITAIHAKAEAGGFSIRSEAMRLNVSGDMGFKANLGTDVWSTGGFYCTLSYQNLSVASRKVVPWLRYEEYFSQGTEANRGKEWIKEGAGGLRIDLTENLSLKAEASLLDYELPFQGLGSLYLKGWSHLLSLTVSF